MSKEHVGPSPEEMGIKQKSEKSQKLWDSPEGQIENPAVARILADRTERSRNYFEVQIKIAEKSGNP